MELSFKTFNADFQPSALTARAKYESWALELGVSTTDTLQGFDGDDGVLAFSLENGCFEVDATNAEFSYEGMVGWSRPVKRNNPIAVDASRMYYLNGIQPDWFVMFRFQYDCRSSAVKLQKANGVTILGGSIHPLSTPLDASHQIDFAFRFSNNRGDAPEIVLTRNEINPGEAAIVRAHNGLNATINTTLQAGASIKVVYTVGDVAQGTFRGFSTTLGRTDSNLPQLTITTPVPPRFVGTTIPRRDYQFGGNGRIAGTVKEKGAPDQPLQRRVQLYDETSKVMTREVWSDPNTGAYVFENIDPKLTYTIISYDYTGMYRAVIANGQKAST